MTWTGQIFSFGQVLTSSQMTNLQADITAIMNQDVGAPAPTTDFISSASQLAAGVVGSSEIAASAVDSSEIATDAVHRAELSTSTLSGSTTSQVTISTTAAGFNAFFPQIYSAAGASCNLAFPTFSPSTSTTAIQIVENASSTAFGDFRYIDASPPYNLGDGDIPLFINAILNNGQLESLAVSVDPAWAGGIRQDKTPHFTDKEGRRWRYVRKLPENAPDNLSFLQKKILLSQQEPEPVLVDQAFKNSDMDLIPHFFTQGNDLSGKIVVMLDPMSEICHQLCALQEEGENVLELFHDDYLQVTNNSVNRAAPLGQLVTDFRWKLTP